MLDLILTWWPNLHLQTDASRHVCFFFLLLFTGNCLRARFSQTTSSCYQFISCKQVLPSLKHLQAGVDLFAGGCGAMCCSFSHFAWCKCDTEASERSLQGGVVLKRHPNTADTVTISAASYINNSVCEERSGSQIWVQFRAYRCSDRSFQFGSWFRLHDDDCLT